jgi:hypothetical protein
VYPNNDKGLDFKMYLLLFPTDAVICFRVPIVYFLLTVFDSNTNVLELLVKEIHKI